MVLNNNATFVANKSLLTANEYGWALRGAEKGGLEKVHGRCTAGSDTMVDPITVLIALSALNLLASAALALWIRRELEESVEELDRTLALAIKATMDQVLENGLGGFEPINPIQAAFAQLIQSYASGKIGALDVQQIVRNDDGTFQKSIEDFE